MLKVPETIGSEKICKPLILAEILTEKLSYQLGASFQSNSFQRAGHF